MALSLLGGSLTYLALNHLASRQDKVTVENDK
jgi:hypothetical protein